MHGFGHFFLLCETHPSVVKFISEFLEQLFRHLQRSIFAVLTFAFAFAVAFSFINFGFFHYLFFRCIWCGKKDDYCGNLD